MKTLLEKSKYLILVAVIGLLITYVFALFWASVKSYDTWVEIISSLGHSDKITVYLIKVIDGFLIAFVLYLLAASIFRMVIGELDIADDYSKSLVEKLSKGLKNVIFK